MAPELQLLLIRGKTDKKTLLSAIEALPHDLGTLPESVIKDLADLVPQMAGLLDLRRQLGDFSEAHTDLIPQLDALADGELDHRLWQIEYKVCQLLPQLGPRARLAVPLLFEHLERYPRFELNAWAIGKIGGPGVAGRLMEWTYLGKYPHDRKCFDSVCGAIHALGESAIAEFLEIASPCNDSVHQRYAALLNLVHNTDYPVERCIPLIVSELERCADGNVDSACRKALRNCLIWLGNQNAEAVSAGIEPLLFAKSAASEDFISVLSELGPVDSGQPNKCRLRVLSTKPGISTWREEKCQRSQLHNGLYAESDNCDCSLLYQLISNQEHHWQAEQKEDQKQEPGPVLSAP